MGVLGREYRIQGGGRRSFAEFVGTSFHVDMFVEACDLMILVRDRCNFEIGNVPSYCI